MKFAFLLAVLIALVAVSSAEWTMTAPKAGDKWTPGVVADLKFTTSEEVDVDGSFPFTYEKLWDVDFAVHGQGAFKWCYVGTATTTPVAVVSAAAGNASVKLLAKVAKDAVVTCQVRVANKATGTLSVGFTGETVEVEITDSAPKVEVVSATANDDRSTNVELKFSGLLPNSIFGPVEFGYKFKAATEADITADPRFYGQFLASDYASVVFGADVRILWQGTQAWIVTGAAAADSTLALKYYDYELTGKVATTDRAEKYSVWASIEDNSADAADLVLKEVGTVQTVEYNQASITRAAGTITYGQTVQITADKPTWTFSISDYDADVVFGTGATLQYIIGGTVKQLTFTDKKFEYELTDAKAKDIVIVSGSFKVTDEFSKLTKFESKVDGKSASAQLVTGCGVTKAEIGSLKDGVVDYTLTIGGDKDFKGEVSCEAWYQYALQQVVGDIRAAGEYTPSCEGTDASVSVRSKVTKDDADLNLRRLTIKATLADGSKTATVKCTQKIGDAAAKRSSKTVSLGPGVTKDLLTAADTVKDLRQKVIIKSRAITDSATFTAVLGEVVTALKAYDEENFGKLVVGDFHYTNDVQTYSAGTLGFDFKFDTFANEYSNQGSVITLAFTATDQPAVPEPINVLADVTSTTLYGTGWQISLLAGAAGPFEAFKDAAVYLDGSADATYLATQFVQHGLGVKCATTQQCAGGYCNKGVCTPLTQLTFAQQAAISEIDGDSSSSSALFTGLALLLAVIAIFA